LTHSHENNDTDLHDNQSSISLNLYVMFTRDMSSRKSVNCDHHSTSNSSSFLVFKKPTVSEGNVIEFLFEWSRGSIHTQIIIANIEPPSRTSPGAPSVFSLVPLIAPRSPRQGLTADTLQTDAILICREAASIRPVASGSRAGVAVVGPVCRRSSSGQPDTVWPSGKAWHRSWGNPRDGDLGPSHREGGNQTFIEELEAIR
jgi:hypothetical protein